MNRTAPDDISAIRILIADSQRLMQWGLRLLIDQQLPRMEVVATASSLAELHAACLTTHPDIIVLDCWLEEEETLPSLSLLASSGARIVIHASKLELDGIDVSGMASMHAVVYKEEPPETLLRAIVAAYLGEQWVPDQTGGNK